MSEGQKPLVEQWHGMIEKQTGYAVLDYSDTRPGGSPRLASVHKSREEALKASDELEARIVEARGNT